MKKDFGGRDSTVTVPLLLPGPEGRPRELLELQMNGWKVLSLPGSVLRGYLGVPRSPVQAGRGGVVSQVSGLLFLLGDTSWPGQRVKCNLSWGIY